MAGSVARVSKREHKAKLVKDEKSAMTGSRVTDDMIKSALADSHGIVTVAATVIKAKYGIDISNVAIRNRMANSEELQTTAKEAVEKILDFAENALFQAVLNNDMRAIFYLLNNKAQHRGYNNNSLSINGGIAVSNVVQVYLPDNKRDNASAATSKRGRGRPRKEETVDAAEIA